MRFGSTDTKPSKTGRTSELSDIDLTQERPVFNNFEREPELPDGLINFESRPYRPWYQRGLILALIAFSFFATVAFVVYVQSDPGYQTVFDDSEVGLATTTTIPTPLSPTAQRRASTLPTTPPETTTTTTIQVAEAAPVTVTIAESSTTTVIESTTIEPAVTIEEAETSSTTILPSTTAGGPVSLPLTVTNEKVGNSGEAVTAAAASGTSTSLSFDLSFVGCAPGQIANVWIFGGDLAFTQIAEADCSSLVTASVDGLAPGFDYGLRVRTGSTWVYRASVTTPED